MEKIIDALDLQYKRCRYDHILDVRSPAEFAEDHMGGAINIPVLTNEQRAEVGTLFKRDPFEARMLGARYVTRAIAEFMDSSLARAFGKHTGLLIYCARGGQRSESLATVLSAVGFGVFRLARGYKTYREFVLARFAQPLPQPVFLLYGYTGSRKTGSLQALRDRCNVLDLEGCAHHRGSLLGDLPDRAQPGQRAFESALLQEIEGFDPAKPTLIEGESRKIGRCTIPDGLWAAMGEGRRLWLEIPLEKRVAYTLGSYRELANADFLTARLPLLAPYLAKRDLCVLTAAIQAGDWPAVAEQLLVHHYDPLYKRERERAPITCLAAADFAEAVAAVAHHISDSSVPRSVP